MDALREEIRAFLALDPPPAIVEVQMHAEAREPGYVRWAVKYASSEGDIVQAFLFEPQRATPLGAVVALHQHNSEWALGKSEIAGLVGDPRQAFGPALARAGLVVLAPDAVGFESRRGGPGYGEGVGPNVHKTHGTPEGWLQYFNHAMFRLVRGERLMTKVLHDVAVAVTALRGIAGGVRLGVLGHSYGGNVALFAAGLDERIDFACVSGAACSYRYKLAHGIALEMALVIPGFAERFDLDDLMRCFAPRDLLVVSAEQDRYSADAADLVERVKGSYVAADAEEKLQHLRSKGEHALDEERFRAIVEWIVKAAER